MLTLDDLAARLDRATVKGSNLSACCPAHDDSTPSLTATTGDTGAIVLHCHAGCDQSAVMAALKVEPADLFPGHKSTGDRRRIVATYDYLDADGELVGQVVRYDPKDFRQRRPDGEGGWVWKGARLPLYRLPDVLRAVEAGRAVWLCEGEKDADALQRVLPEGEVATTAPGGAGKWRPDFTAWLTGADVVIVRDRDKSGAEHAEQVAAALRPVAAVKVLEPAHGKDAADHLGAGYSVGDFVPVDPEAEGGVVDDTELTANLLRIESVAELAARVDAAPPPRWLVRNLIVSGTYGGFAAEDTSGKSLAALDLAVNVAAGGKWLDRYEVDDPGPVLMFLGEGDDRETMRRGRAIAAHYGHTFEALPLRISHRVPKLTNELHIAYVRAELEAHPARLVVLDPLYLAITGVKTSTLNEVGGALEPIQHACQDHGATLWIAHHWNKTGTGTDRHRATGAGFPEWCRVVGSVNVAATTKVGTASVVTLEWDIVGNGIPGERFKVRRKVWADDPTDLSSPLHYELHDVDQSAEPDDGYSPAQRRVLAILHAAEEPLDVKAIGDLVAKDGTDMPLRKRTIQDALRTLAEFGEAHDDGVPKGHTPHWSAGPGDAEVFALDSYREDP